MKHVKYIFLLLFVSFTLILTTTPAADAGITCEYSDLNFGEIQVGTSSFFFITCTADTDNTDTWTIDGALVEGGEVAFMLTPNGFDLPYIISPGESVDIFVEFSPTIANRTYQAFYNINGSMPNNGYWYETAMMQGYGVYFETPPTEPIQEILDFIDEAIDSGELEGSGRGRSSDNRLNALINMIETAGEIAPNIGDNFTERPLYTGEGHQVIPRISGNQVVFPSDNTDGLSAILIGDVINGGFARLTNFTNPRERFCDIDGDIVVFEDTLQPAVVAYEITTNTVIEFLTNFKFSRTDGNYLTFYGLFGLYNNLWVKELNGDLLYPVEENLEYGYTFAPISNGRLAYTKYNSPTTGQVFLHDIETYTTTLIDDGNHYPDIDGDRIVYSKYVGEGNLDLFLYTIGSVDPPQNITNRAGKQLLPAIIGNYVVYQDDSAGNYDIYLYLINEKLTFRVTSDPSDQKYPDIDNGHIVYGDYRNDDLDIYVTDFSITTPQAACEQLQSALKRCDGEEADDFVSGDARETLYEMIENLMLSIGCN